MYTLYKHVVNTSYVYLHVHVHVSVTVSDSEALFVNLIYKTVFTCHYQVLNENWHSRQQTVVTSCICTIVCSSNSPNPCVS